MAPDSFAERATSRLRRQHGALLASGTPTRITPQPPAQDALLDVVQSRANAVAQMAVTSFATSLAEAERAVELLASWMEQRAIIRIIDAGGSPLAAGLAARRLFAGGARVHMQQQIVPIPPAINGGGIIALCGDGHPDAIVGLLRSARGRNRDIKIVGIGSSAAVDVAELCDAFVGVQSIVDDSQDLALDLQSHVVAHVLDSLVVYAGRTLGYTALRWQLGEENLIVGNLLPARPLG